LLSDPRLYVALARGERTDPVLVLRRKVRRDRGTQPAISPAIVEVLALQYRALPGWSFQLHADNLATRVREDPALGPMPSDATVRRHLKGRGMTRQRRLREHRETRSYEVTHVHGLWHLDFHLCSRKVLLPDGRWVTLRGVLDVTTVALVAAHPLLLADDWSSMPDRPYVPLLRLAHRILTQADALRGDHLLGRTIEALDGEGRGEAART